MIKYWTEEHWGSSYIFSDNGKVTRIFDLAGRLYMKIDSTIEDPFTKLEPPKGGAGE
jgi:calcineurin-like phosphoesterase